MPNESLQVLLFICLPLTLLLVAVMALMVRSSRRTVTFPSFSLSISSYGTVEAHVVYRREGKEMYFDAAIGRGKNFFIPKIRVLMPRDMPEQDVRTIVPDLVMGLEKLRYEYVICRRLEPR